MSPAIYAIAAIVVGFILLTWSADRFVGGAAATAKNWGISPMLIGLTVVSIGTSAPEILVSLMSSLQGHNDIAVGNAIGSNIANMGLVLGLTALIAPLPVKTALAKREIPWLLLVTVIAGACLANNYLGLIESLVLLSGLFVTLYLMVTWQKSHPEEPLAEIEEIEELPSAKAYLELVGGLVLLLVSAQILVWGATEIATWLGVSELIVGLTVVAIGTSLPELAASVASALRGHHDIALGNVVGSNIFNLLAVLSMPGLVRPGAISESVFSRDYTVMLAFTVLLAAMAIVGKKPKTLGRFAGIIFLAGYACYGTWLYVQTV
ncbi:calcium/sodium antiporter [Endozoicomonas sp. GU-1]|uniref:calcium/sodium antiporter n=1 Tax=Endozoicomonas sp. GU-1 TaxID=3009078 RepID=UPI0022B5BC90|nr:calcium/sodium antiporter [Endozoicomonas sp. GU-1]WBA80884.1 calcium/sodium antiporter [Endozoicomonas sp. GU-1]WBA88448.1 calcium/sodium antiporter [Endozoicomonas sp. GU-1]